MHRGSRMFVYAVFVLLGFSFLAETLTMMFEFRDTGWWTILTHDSHLFLFFPTLGLVALAAFSTPAAAFTDMYWHHVPYGRARFAIGFVVLAGLSVAIAVWLDQSPYRPVWNIAPDVLAGDRNEPPGCGGAKPCERIAILESLENVREVSSRRLGLKDFVRKCATETLIEPSPDAERKRFCFASTPLSSTPRLSGDSECCRAQALFQQHIVELYDDSAKRSLTGTVHSLLLPLKVFFLLVLGVISVLLAIRHRSVAEAYPREIGRIDLGVIVGAVAMIFFPLMSQAFVQTADALYGTLQNAGFKPIVNAMSAAFGAWALLLLMFFYRRHDREVELAGKIAGVVASAVAVVKYDLMIALMVRYLGSGAGVISIAAVVLLSIAAVLLLLSPRASEALERGARGNSAPRP